MWCLFRVEFDFRSQYILKFISLFCPSSIDCSPVPMCRLSFDVCYYFYYSLVVVVLSVFSGGCFEALSMDFYFVFHVHDAIRVLPMPFLVNVIYKQTELPHVQMYKCVQCTVYGYRLYTFHIFPWMDNACACECAPHIVCLFVCQFKFMFPSFHLSTPNTFL